MEIFPFFLFPYDESDRRKEKFKRRVRDGSKGQTTACHVFKRLQNCPLLTIVYNCLCGLQVLYELSNGFEKEKTERS